MAEPEAVKRRTGVMKRGTNKKQKQDDEQKKCLGW